MKSKSKFMWLFVAVSMQLLLMSNSGCDRTTAVSSSGVKKATAQVKTDMNGHSVEQRNILERIERDNQVGAVKHLYVISAYSGQVIIYSTVVGKVTSGGKRLNPSTVDYDPNGADGFAVQFGNDVKYTKEVLGDDGAYGSGGDYIYWFDSKDVYHQHYLSGGQIIHISDQPLAVKSVTINMEVTAKQSQADTLTK